MKALKKQEPEAPAKPERVEYVLPAVNVYETDDGYLLEADMPGVTKDGLSIYLDQNELTLIGRRSQIRPKMQHYRESSDGDFRRIFELDPEIDTEKITARVENGVLTLNLAKREHAKLRRITIAD
jgi:HSP20 family protein